MLQAAGEFWVPTSGPVFYERTAGALRGSGFRNSGMLERVNRVSAVMNGCVLRDVSGPVALMTAEQTVLMKTDCEAQVPQRQRLQAIFHLRNTPSRFEQHAG